MKESIKELKSKLESLSLDEFGEFKEDFGELVSEYHSKTYARAKLLKKREDDAKTKRIARLSEKFEYNEPEFPSFVDIEDGNDLSGSVGSCDLTSKEEAEEFAHLKSSYEYTYVVIWSGPGRYFIYPTFKQDHDGLYVYTATFRKEES